MGDRLTRQGRRHHRRIERHRRRQRAALRRGGRQGRRRRRPDRPRRAGRRANSATPPASSSATSPTRTAIAAAIELAIDTWGRLDVMFNNAGVVGAVGPVADTDSAAWATQIDILLHSVFYGCKHAARVMVPQGSGSIISTSSIAGVARRARPARLHRGQGRRSIGLTKSVAAELGPQGVRCNAIAPGTVPTALTARRCPATSTTSPPSPSSRGSDTARASDAMDIANAALYLASDEAGYVNGHTLVVDYGRTTNGGSARFAGSSAGMVGIPGSGPRPHSRRSLPLARSFASQVVERLAAPNLGRTGEQLAWPSNQGLPLLRARLTDRDPRPACSPSRARRRTRTWLTIPGRWRGGRRCSRTPSPARACRRGRRRSSRTVSPSRCRRRTARRSDCRRGRSPGRAD